MRFFIALLIAAVLLTVGCTDKANQTGYDNNILDPENVTMSDSLVTYAWNYRDTVQNYDGATINTLGNYQNIRLMTLIRWDDLPSDAQALSATMYIKPVNDVVPDSMTIRIARMPENWEEEDCTWTYAADEIEWETPGHDYEAIASFQYDSAVDTLAVTFPLDLLQEWLDNITNDEDETNNFGIALFTDTPDQFLEIYSLDSDYAPLLEFDYTVDGETLTYSEDAIDDVTIYNNPDEDTTLGESFDGMFLSNIYPYRTVIKLNFDYDQFNEALSVSGLDELTAYDYTHTTINRAELVFDIDADQSYAVDGTFSARAYMMLTEEPSVPLIYTEDYLYYTGNDVAYYDEDTGQIRVDITSLLQAIVSGEAENHGFLIRSVEEDRDLGHILSTSDPYLDVTFTRPFIEEF